MDKDILSLVDCFRVVKKRKALIAISTALITLTGAGYAFLGRPATFTVTGVVRIGRVAERQIESSETTVAVWRSPARLQKAFAAAEVGYPLELSARKLRDMVNINSMATGPAETGVELVEISVTRKDPREAAALAENLGLMIIADHREKFINLSSVEDELRRELEADILRLSDMIDRMENNLRSLKEDDATTSLEFVLLESGLESRLRLLLENRREVYRLERALSAPSTFPTDFLELPLPPIKPNPRRRLLITIAAFGLGLVVSTTIAFAREYLESAN